ncbi:cation/multidrug efflux pump [Salinisphaera sp. USBA-960]|nr:cation/multidrug efflux pump [Salifodinibacter halophilus]
MIGVNLIVAVLLVGGALLLLRAGLHARRRRLARASRSGVGGGVLLTLGGLGVAVLFNLYTYQRLTYEQPVATLASHKVGDALFRVQIRPAHGSGRTFEVAGASWRLDARVLKWRGWANMVGLDARYRLTRLTGRYQSLQRARQAQHTAYDLGNSGAGLDVWWLANWLGLVDTRYGGSAYMPMAAGARYTVVLSQSGLVARPANAAARSATRRWNK